MRSAALAVVVAAMATVSCSREETPVERSETATSSAIDDLTEAEMKFLASAGEARRFAIPIQGDSIDLQRDHYSVALVEGWTSSKDQFWEALLKRKSKLVVAMRGQASFTDQAQTLEISYARETGDISRRTDRSWGLNPVLLNRLPGEANTVLTIQSTVHREDRLSEIFRAADASKAELGNLFDAAWVGYSRVIAQLLSTLFPKRETYPFYWSGDIKFSEVVKGKRMAPHYLALVAPQNDKDTLLKKLDASKLSYDRGSKQLRYSGQPFMERSFTLWEISKAEGYNIVELLNGSQAPWAVLANSQFVVIPVADATSADDLRAVEKNLVEQLGTERSLLLAELRFSIYDRAVALYAFALTGKEEISAKCQALKIAANCPVSELTQFMNRIAQGYRLSPDLEGTLAADAARIKTRIVRR